MGLLSYFCGSSRRRDTATSPPLQPLHLNHGSMDQSIEDDDNNNNNNKEDILAVMSWREKRTAPPTASSLLSSSSHITSTAFVAFGDDWKLGTSEKGIHGTRSASISSQHTFAPTMKDYDNNLQSSPPLTSDEKQSQEQQKESLTASIDDRSTNLAPSNGSSRTYVRQNFQSLLTAIENGIYNVHDSINNDPTINPVNYGVGVCPAESPREEDWRKEQQEYLFSQHQSHEYCSSSSSNSTIEDPIFIRTSNGNDDKRNVTGPIDLDIYDEIMNPLEKKKYIGQHYIYNQIQGHDMDVLLSFSFELPGPDDADIDRHINATYHPKNHSPHSGSSDHSVNYSTLSDYDKCTNSVVSKQQHHHEISSSTSIIYNKEPDLSSRNNFSVSEELDAMTAASHNSKNDAKIMPIPLTMTAKHFLVWSSMIHSSPSLHSGNQSSPPSVKILPNCRDSLSLHDPTKKKRNGDTDNIINTTSEQEMNRTVLAMISPSITCASATTAVVPTRHGQKSTIPATVKIHETAHTSNRSKIKQFSTLELPVDEAIFTVLVPAIIQPDKMENDMVLDPPQRTTEIDSIPKMEDLPFLLDNQSSYNARRRNVIPSQFNVTETLHPSDMDHSDMRTEVDHLLREQYWKACQILNSSQLQKEEDMYYFPRVLLEAISSRDNGDDINSFFTEMVTSRCNGPSSKSMIDNLSTDEAIFGECGVVTEQKLQIHDNVINTLHCTNDSIRRKLMQINTTTESHKSSGLSRLFDDYPYTVLGLNVGCHSKVMLPWMMNELRALFPLEISKHNFWLKYQFDRNTDINSENNVNLTTLLSKVQHDKYTLLCVETVDGYVFGAFCSTPWEIKSFWYGSGDSSFLWRLKAPRRLRANSNAANENHDGNMNEIEIYPYTRYDPCVQYCSYQTLAVGGGTDWALSKEGYSPYCHPSSDDESPPLGDQTGTGVGFILDGDLMGGETNSCVTFANPRLGNNILTENGDGSNEFDIQTIEVYTFTMKTGHTIIDF